MKNQRNKLYLATFQFNVSETGVFFNQVFRCKTAGNARRKAERYLNRFYEGTKPRRDGDTWEWDAPYVAVTLEEIVELTPEQIVNALLWPLPEQKAVKP
jgi:hypothetical protein